MRSYSGVKKFTIKPAFAGIVFSLLGTVLYGSAKGPDIAQGEIHILGAFLLFLSYLIAQFCWGEVITNFYSKQAKAWEKFFAGSLFFSLLIGVLGFFPILGESSKLGWQGFFFCGYLLSMRLLSGRRCSLRRISAFDGIAMFVFLLAILGTFTAHGFWDSLWYHLPASRIWFAAKQISMPDYFPILCKTGLWDYQFVYGQILLGSDGDGGLIAAQLFGQWANLSAVLLCYLLLREEKDLFGLSLFSSLFAILGTELFMMAEFAKNDWGAIFWSLSFLVFSFQRRSAILLGFSAAACFTAKYTSAFFLLPLLILYFLEEKRMQERIIFLVSFTLICTPILLRNYLFTNNPFFPALSNIFQAFMGPSWAGIKEYEGISWGILAIKEKLFYLIHDSWICLAALFLPFTWKSWNGKQKILMASIALSLFCFLLFTGVKAEWRLSGAALLLAAAYGARSLELFLETNRANPKIIFALTFVLLLLLPVDWKAPQRLALGPTLSEQVRAWVSGSAVAWTRLQLPPEAKIATLNEQRTYYLTPHQMLRVFDIPVLDRELAVATSVEEASKAIRHYGIRYLVLSAEFLDSYYSRKICDWFYQVSEKNPQAVLFRTEYSRVLDLDLVK